MGTEYGGVDNLFTDANGVVTFPERTVTASLSYRVVVTAVRAIGALVHAGGWGIHGSVYATGFVSPDGTWALIYRQGKPLPDTLVVEECLFSAEIDAFRSGFMAKNTLILLNDHSDNMTKRRVKAGEVIRAKPETFGEVAKKAELINELKKGEKSGFVNDFDKQKFLRELQKRSLKL